MKRTTLLLTFLCSFILCQVTYASDTTRLAPVSVKVTDMKNKPTRGQHILFRSKATQTIYSGKSDASGKFFIQLPMGDEYIITVKSLTDTSKYGVINIPALAAEEEYAEPFTVNVKFAAAKSYKLDRVYFDFGKVTLRPESFPELEELVDFLVNREDIAIEIAGDNYYNADEEQQKVLKLYRFSNRLAEPLSKREMDVLTLLEQGLNNRQVAQRLFISENTLKTHLKIYSP